MFCRLFFNSNKKLIQTNCCWKFTSEQSKSKKIYWISKNPEKCAYSRHLRRRYTRERASQSFDTPWHCPGTFKFGLPFRFELTAQDCALGHRRAKTSASRLRLGGRHEAVEIELAAERHPRIIEDLAASSLRPGQYRSGLSFSASSGWPLSFKAFLF